MVEEGEEVEQGGGKGVGEEGREEKGEAVLCGGGGGGGGGGSEG